MIQETAGTPAVLRIQRGQSVWGRNCGAYREEVALTSTRYESASGRGRGWCRRKCELQLRRSQSKAVAMKQQGAWMKWEFLIHGVYDVLPSLSTLCPWGKIETPPCSLYFKTAHPEQLFHGAE